jgi:hypothetical protein
MLSIFFFFFQLQNSRDIFFQVAKENCKTTEEIGMTKPEL